MDKTRHAAPAKDARDNTLPGRARDISALVEDIARIHDLPSLAVAINVGGKESLTAATGHGDAGGEHRVDADTRFGIASVTKMMTSAVAVRLEEEGKLDLDAPVADHYPDLDLARDRQLKLYHLLCHGSGLPGLPGRFYARNLDDSDDRSGGLDRAPRGVDLQARGGRMIDTPQELAQLINAFDFLPLGRPGELLNYSNEAYCLAGGILARVSGQGYRAAMQGYLFDPLGMTRTSVGPNASLAENVAAPLVRNESGFTPTRYWNAPLWDPTGGVISSARDLAGMIERLVGAEMLLGAAGRRRMRRRYMDIAALPHADYGYGLGLQQRRLAGGEVFHFHSGQRAGVSSFLGHLSQAETSISVLSNVADAPIVSIGHEILRAFTGREDLVWPPVVGAPRPARHADAKRSGRYASAEGTVLEVGWQEDGLVLIDRDKPAPMVFRGADHGTAGTRSFRFLAGPEGRARLALDLRIYHRDG